MPANITVQQYAPSEIIGIFNDILAHQNTRAARNLNEAKERSRQLEKQLGEALSKGNSNMWMFIAIIAAIAFVAALLIR